MRAVSKSKQVSDYIELDSMDTLDLVFVVLILSAASFVQSATGFGLALVCLAVLPMIMPVKESIALITLFNLGITATILVFNRSGFSFRKAIPLMIGGIIGIPIGYKGLHAMDGTVVIRVLGVLLILIALNELLKGRILPHLHIPEKAGVPMGIIAGIMGGAFNVGGPPIVVYLFSRDWGKTQTVAVMQTVFLIMGSFRVGLMIHEGDCSPQLFQMSAFAIVPALAAVWLGKKALDHFPPETLKQIVFTMILGLGIWYSVAG